MDMNPLFLAEEIQILHKHVWRFSTLKLGLLVITVFIQMAWWKSPYFIACTFLKTDKELTTVPNSHSNVTSLWNGKQNWLEKPISTL